MHSAFGIKCCPVVDDAMLAELLKFEQAVRVKKSSKEMQVIFTSRHHLPSSNSEKYGKKGRRGNVQFK